MGLAGGTDQENKEVINKPEFFNSLKQKIEEDGGYASRGKNLHPG